jgi:hypothetical protein
MAAAMANLSLEEFNFPMIVSGAWRDAMDGKTVHFQSQNHSDKKHLKLTGNGTIECTGGKGKPASWVIRKGKGLTYKFESVSQPGVYLKVNAKGEYTTGPGGGDPCMFHVDFVDFGAATCRLQNVKFPDGRVGVKPNGEMKPYNDTGEGAASHFQISGGDMISPLWFQILPKGNNGVALNVYSGKVETRLPIKLWAGKGDNALFRLDSVNKRQHRIVPKHAPGHSLNIEGGIANEAQVITFDDAGPNSMFHTADFDGQYFRLQAKGHPFYMNVWGGNAVQEADIKMYNDKNENSLFRLSFAL